jgi:hypothetical protein
MPKSKASRGKRAGEKPNERFLKTDGKFACTYSSIVFIPLPLDRSCDLIGSCPAF